MNGSGAQTVYSDYLTTCSTTAIGQTEVAPAATKILRNGQIYILVGEQMYNLTGQKIK
jgi:hypothetical protein